MNTPPTMTEAASRDWRPELKGWADDILPAYAAFAKELPSPCTVVEIGSAHGRSAIFLAQELIKLGHGSHSKIFMVDDWGGGWFGECLPSLVKHATASELELLRPLRTTSEHARAMFRENSLDMVFVDGDHSRIGCARDIDAWWRAIVPTGIFAGHDYDEAAHPGVVQSVDAFVASHTEDLRELGRPAPVLTRPTRSVWRLR